MIEDQGLFNERVTFLSENYWGTPQQANLHPIDQLLPLTDRTTAYYWYSALRRIGITYLTPCRWIRTNKEWSQYCDSGYNTLLVVSFNAYLLMSDYKVLNRYGKIATEADIQKDKQHFKCGRLVFDHHITQEEYRQRIFNC